MTVITRRAFAAAAIVVATALPASADDQLKLTIGQRGNWDTTIAFSTNGSSTHSIVRAFINEFNIKAKPTPTGNPSATLTAVMTDQVDIGWASPPFGLKEIEEGKIRVVARATDAALVRGQTIRVLVANTDALAKRKEAMSRFM